MGGGARSREEAERNREIERYGPSSLGKSGWLCSTAFQLRSCVLGDFSILECMNGPRAEKHGVRKRDRERKGQGSL